MYFFCFILSFLFIFDLKAACNLSQHTPEEIKNIVVRILVGDGEKLPDEFASYGLPTLNEYIESMAKDEHIRYQKCFVLPRFITPTLQEYSSGKRAAFKIENDLNDESNKVNFLTFLIKCANDWDHIAHPITECEKLIYDHVKNYAASNAETLLKVFDFTLLNCRFVFPDKATLLKFSMLPDFALEIYSRLAFAPRFYYENVFSPEGLFDNSFQEDELPRDVFYQMLNQEHNALKASLERCQKNEKKLNRKLKEFEEFDKEKESLERGERIAWQEVDRLRRQLNTEKFENENWKNGFQKLSTEKTMKVNFLAQQISSLNKEISELKKNLENEQINTNFANQRFNNVQEKYNLLRKRMFLGASLLLLWHFKDSFSFKVNTALVILSFVLYQRL